NPSKHEWMQRAKLNTLRLSGSMYNVLMIQKYSGIDAERVDGRGYDMADGYPLHTKYTLGIQFDFEGRTNEYKKNNTINRNYLFASNEQHVRFLRERT